MTCAITLEWIQKDQVRRLYVANIPLTSARFPAHFTLQDVETCNFRVANFYFKHSRIYGCRNLWGPSYLCARSKSEK